MKKDMEKMTVAVVQMNGQEHKQKNIIRRLGIFSGGQRRGPG